MTMKATLAMHYKFGTKNNWRRRSWNLIRERLAVAPSKAKVLYLAGELNLDLPVAMDRGFRPANMIAIEHDRRTAQSLRKSGTLVVEGDAGIITAGWPVKHPINVLILDHCGGAQDYRVGSLAMTLRNPAFHDTVVSLNFLRGREKNWGLAEGMVGYDLSSWTGVAGDEKHRALLAFNVFVWDMICESNDAGPAAMRDDAMRLSRLLPEGDRALSYLKANPDACATLYPTFVCRLSGLVIGSYRSSSGRIFDWCVFRNYFTKAFRGQLVFQHKTITRSIGATMAHRTRRLNGGH